MSILSFSEKITSMEREQKSLKRSGEKWRMASMRMKEHERETTDMVQKNKLDKKTITTLREVSMRAQLPVPRIGDMKFYSEVCNSIQCNSVRGSLIFIRCFIHLSVRLL